MRIYTDAGIDGVGFGRVDLKTAESVIGKRLCDLWRPPDGSVGSLGRADHALFDLVGKVLDVPAWKLIGRKGPKWVPVYDTSIWFSDLLPEYQTCGIARVLDEVRDGLKEGHRAFKIKVGRGARWMEHEEGLARDIEVVLAVRDLCGPGIRLMADASDQYGSIDSRTFLEACGNCLEFLEEPFPEHEKECRELREWIAKKGLETKLADGETENEPRVLASLAKRGALDVLQPDIRRIGLSLQRSLAEEIDELPGVSIASHNWGSYLGTFMMLQLARGISNFLIAEVDSSKSELFDDEEWCLKDGRIKVPDSPGCGLRLREDVYRQRYLPNCWHIGKVPGR